MSSIDQQFVEFVVKSLVGNPDAVSIERSVDEKGVLLELTVDPEDLGRIIGKRGATAQSLRTLLRALGTKNEARYNLKIIDNGPQDNYRPEQSNNRSDDNASPQRDQSPQTARDDDDEAPESASRVEESADENVSEERDHSEAISKARKELADLDDLDI